MVCFSEKTRKPLSKARAIGQRSTGARSKPASATPTATVRGAAIYLKTIDCAVRVQHLLQRNADSAQWHTDAAMKEDERGDALFALAALARQHR